MGKKKAVAVAQTTPPVAPPPKTYEDGVKVGYEAARLDSFLEALKLLDGNYGRVVISRKVYSFIAPLVVERRKQLPDSPFELGDEWLRFLYTLKGEKEEHKWEWKSV